MAELVYALVLGTSDLRVLKVRILPAALVPGWRNGRRSALRSRWASARAGSNPALGIYEGVAKRENALGLNPSGLQGLVGSTPTPLTTERRKAGVLIGLEPRDGSLGLCEFDPHPLLFGKVAERTKAAPC